MPSVASVALSPLGGREEVHSAAFRFQDLVSVERAVSRVWGERGPLAGSWTTAVETTVEGFNLLGVVTADRISARFVAMQSAGGELSVREGSITIAGLRIEGQPVRVLVADSNLYKGTQEEMRGKYRDQAEFWKHSGELSQVMPLVERLEFEGPSPSPNIQIRGNEVLLKGFGAIRLGELGIAADRRSVNMLGIDSINGEK